MLKSSADPQLMEMTDGRRMSSCKAALSAARKPLSVLSPKYTAIVAWDATAPATSMSSITSPSASESTPGTLAPTLPSLATPTAVTRGVRKPSDVK